MSHNILPPRDAPGVPTADYGPVTDCFLDRVAKDAGATTRACKQLHEAAIELSKMTPDELSKAECVLVAMAAQLKAMERMWHEVVLEIYDPTPPYGLDLEEHARQEQVEKAKQRPTQPMLTPISRRPPGR